MVKGRQILIFLATVMLASGSMGAQCGSSSPSSSSTPGTTTTTTGTTNPGGPTPVNTAVFSATAIPPNNATVYLHQASSFTSTCSIPVADIGPGGATPPSGNANNDLTCILDANEGDLYFQGMSLNFNAPPGVCNYTTLSYYWFWELAPGAPGNVTYCESEATTNAGAIVSSSAVNGTVNATTGIYTCSSDYSTESFDDVPGPNCCEGTYQLTVETSSDGTSATCGNPQVSTVGYAGLAGNCAVGPGVDLALHKDRSGLPEGFVYDTLISGVNTSITVVSPDSKQLGSNLYIANYFDPTLNSGNPPDALQAHGGYSPQPYYELKCLDAGADVLARIRVQIRSWDTVAGFTDQSNPYTSGNESGFNNPAWHTYDIWEDMESSFPTPFY